TIFCLTDTHGMVVMTTSEAVMAVGYRGNFYEEMQVKKIIAAIVNHRDIISVFSWANSPEGKDFWNYHYHHGHTTASIAALRDRLKAIGIYDELPADITDNLMPPPWEMDGHSTPIAESCDHDVIVVDDNEIEEPF
ncbi:MAG: hypothetical protein WC284_15300, partial [Candidimonas sp.]